MLYVSFHLRSVSRFAAPLQEKGAVWVIPVDLSPLWCWPGDPACVDDEHCHVWLEVLFRWHSVSLVQTSSSPGLYFEYAGGGSGIAGSEPAVVSGEEAATPGEEAFPFISDDCTGDAPRLGSGVVISNKPRFLGLSPPLPVSPSDFTPGPVDTPEAGLTGPILAETLGPLISPAPNRAA